MYAYTIYNNFPCITIIIKISFDFPCKEFNLRNLSINMTETIPTIYISVNKIFYQKNTLYNGNMIYDFRGCNFLQLSYIWFRKSHILFVNAQILTVHVIQVKCFDARCINNGQSD